MLEVPPRGSRTQIPLDAGQPSLESRRPYRANQHLLVPDRSNRKSGATALSVGIRRFEPDTELLRQGEEGSNLYLIDSGWLYSYTLLPDGRRQIFDFPLAGDWLGLEMLCSGGMTNSVCALTAVTAHVIPRERLSNSLSELASELLPNIVGQLARREMHLVNIGRRTSRARVAHMLLELFFRANRRLECVTEGAAYVPVGLNHLGDALGLTHIHVSRVLGELKANGIAEKHRRIIRVMDLSALLTIAGCEVETLTEAKTHFG